MKSWTLVLTALLLSNAALADDTALKKCRALTDSAARLACYDAIPIGAVSAPTAASAVSTRTAAPVVSNAAAAAKPVPAPSATFGLQATAPDAVLDRIESSIVGEFEGWRPNSRIRFANGQVWQVADDTSRSLDLKNPKVAVRRGALGSFYLEIEGTNHSPRVRRVQ